MRILVVTPDLKGPGGVAHYYRALQKHFPKSVQYMIIGKRYENYQIPVFLRLLMDFFVFLFKVVKYDIVMVNPSLCQKCFLRESVFLAIAMLFRKKRIVFFRGWESSFEQSIETRWRWLFKLVYARSNAMIVLAEEFESKLQHWGYAGKIYMETTTVDEHLLDDFDPETRQLDSESISILFLSRIEVDKGIFESVDAVEELMDTRYSFIIGGSGNAELALKDYIEEKKYVSTHMVGYLSGEQNIIAYQNADIFLLPSYHDEGMPNSVLEAMAFGLPIITSAIGGLKDFFIDGEMGYLVPVRDSSAIAARIKLLSENTAKWRKISLNNAKYARNRFYSSVIAKRLKSMFEQVYYSGR